MPTITGAPTLSTKACRCGGSSYAIETEGPRMIHESSMQNRILNTSSRAVCEDEPIDRAVWYGFLAVAFLSPPTLDLAASLESATTELPPVHALRVPAHQLAQSLKDHAASAHSGLSEGIPGPNPIAREYYRLFFNPQGSPCPLWQSQYYGERRHLMSESHLSALAWYRRFGLEPVNAGAEPADHLGLLLAFAQKLAEMVAEGAIEEEISQTFGRDHLSGWVTEFCHRLERCAQHPVFTALASLTDRFLEICDTGGTASAVESPQEPLR